MNEIFSMVGEETEMPANQTKQQKAQNRSSKKSTKENKIFISWSGPHSKEFAKGIKKLLEESVFENKELTCFVSDLDIASGSDWWLKIKKELRSCKLGILCITKENLRAPWIYFEAGAMIAREIPSIPLLVSCDIKALSSTPLNGKQAVDFYDIKKFLKMLVDINNAMEFDLTENQVKELGKAAYTKLKNDLESVFSSLRDLRLFNVKYVYPRDTTIVKRNTIFVSAPMSSINSDEYDILRESALKIKELLLDIGFTEVYCPLIEKESQDRFDGKTKAIKNNFPLMKSVDSMLFIYPWKNASSALVEMGYGIALSKRMVVFYNEGLPYIMDEAGVSINNIKTYSFSTYDKIFSIIERNGMDLFEGVADE